MKKINSIITAAGRSKRFKDKKHKLLYVIKKKTILENVFKKVSSFSNNTIIVCNKHNINHIKKILFKYKKKNKILYVIQNKTNGMATAVMKGLSKVSSSNFIVIWGDQYYLKKETIKKTIICHEKRNSLITFPYFKIKNPYTYIIRDKKRNFVDILQKREFFFKMKIGENDCGFFVCKTERVKKELKKLIKAKKILTSKTKEYDFIKSFKYLKKYGDIFTIKASSEIETRGINTKRDLIKE